MSRIAAAALAVFAVTAQAQSEYSLPDGWEVVVDTHSSLTAKADPAHSDMFGYRCTANPTGVSCTSIWGINLTCPPDGATVGVTAYVTGPQGGTHFLTGVCVTGDITRLDLFTAGDNDSYAFEMATAFGDQVTLTLFKDTGQPYSRSFNLKGSLNAYQFIKDALEKPGQGAKS